MPEIKNVSILGAGAMGAYFATTFARSGFATSLVARGQRGQRLTDEGLIVNGQTCFLPVLHPAETPGPADLIVVAVKHHHLAAALPDLENLVGEQTILISVMNGLDSEEMIAALYGPQRVLYAVSVGIDAVRQGNRVTFTIPGKHYFGHATNTQPSEQVRRLQAAFDRAGITHETPPDMIRILWWKFMVNVGMNQASAVLRAPYGFFRVSQPGRALVGALMDEVIALARIANVNLVEQDIHDWYTVLNTLSPEGKTSMFQDIEAGRKTEVEIFGGKVVDLGKEHGLPTPVNQTVLHIIQALEQQPGTQPTS